MNKPAPSKPMLSATPTELHQGDRLTLTGRGWPDCPISIRIGKQSATVVRIGYGFPAGGQVRPAGDGTFVAALSTADIPAGERRITAQAAEASAYAKVRILEQPGPGSDGPIVKHAWRAREFFERRFGHLGFVPAGTRETQIRQLRNIGERAGGGPRPAPGADDVFAQPDPAVCNWTPVGPAPAVTSSGVGWAGRTLAIAIDPTAPDTVYVGTAGGGVWKTTDGGDTWTPLTDYQASLSIGAIAIDPTNAQRLLAGTGEYNNGYVGTYYGAGVLRSVDGGANWSEHGAATFERAEISRIAYDPSDATGMSVFLSSSVGVYHSPDGGVNWNLLEAGDFSGLVVFGTGGNKLKAIAGRLGDGLYEATRTGNSWSAWSKITDPVMPANLGRIALGQRGFNSKTVYALFERFGGFEAVVSTNNGGNNWSSVDVRLNKTPTVGVLEAAGHDHTLTIPATDMTAPTAAHTYTTGSGGAPVHTHQVTLDADTFERVARGSVVVATTDADGSGHQHTVVITSTGQGGYNLHVSPHPDDPNTVFLGEVRLWRSTSGGGVFNEATGIHVDHHAFAFDRTAAATAWAGSDGGVWKSADTGATWSHRNRDLATLMYIDLAQHPDWESVLLAGTQDNGTHRYEGSPAWLVSVSGDGGFAAIDPGLPTRMYHLFFALRIQRSDGAGQPGTWANKNSGLSGSSQFYAPFTLDPSNPNTCFVGGTELFRSANNADSWDPVTDSIGENITAIAVHPTDSDVVYVGTSTGKIFLVANSGAWALADVSATDLSAPPYPVGVHVSDLAVDPAGTLWATVGAVLWTEATGEFSNDHVWRLQSGAGATWENRSTGLAQANPINAIAIDPANPSRLFCGGDVGVFRTDSAGAMWQPWDQGLPNAPVYRLAIHGPRRLVRAATHGRSIWERPIDTASCPLVDLYVRDNILDSGRVTPSPSHLPHPFDAGKTVYWWQSADVKVDSSDPDPFQTTDPIDDTIEFMLLNHRDPVREKVNRFSVQVHNRGVLKATNVRARAFFADASAGLPALPADFWSAGRPFVGTPLATDWTPIGPTKTVAELEPAEPAVLTWEWTVAAGAAKHSCLLAVVTCDEDPISAAGVFDLDTLVPGHKHATLKNLHLVNATAPATGTPDGAWQIAFHNPGPRPRQYDVVIDWGDLPDRATLFLAAERLGQDRWEPKVAGRDQRVRPAPGKEVLPGRLPDGCGGWRRFDLDGALALRRPKTGETRLGGLIVPAGGRRTLALNMGRLRLEGDAQFSVLQTMRKRTLGGSTYLVRGRRTEE
ncbi:MAG: glycosyl hydrolase [Gemmatimonadota bacterium]